LKLGSISSNFSSEVTVLIKFFVCPVMPIPGKSRGNVTDLVN
jgi:hypothetical protein